jgi:hypothetical protein
MALETFGLVKKTKKATKKKRKKTTKKTKAKAKKKVDKKKYEVVKTTRILRMEFIKQKGLSKKENRILKFIVNTNQTLPTDIWTLSNYHTRRAWKRREKDGKIINNDLILEITEDEVKLILEKLMKSFPIEFIPDCYKREDSKDLDGYLMDEEDKKQFWRIIYEEVNKEVKMPIYEENQALAELRGFEDD